MRRNRSVLLGILIAIVLDAIAAGSDGEGELSGRENTGRATREIDSSSSPSSSEQGTAGRLRLPEQTSRTLGGFEIVVLTQGNELHRYSMGRGDRWIRTTVAGVRGNLIGIDWRPADGLLYGINDANDLYRVDPDSGRAERISSLTLGFEGSESSAFDFNPQADRLRLIAASGQNLRVQVVLGAVAADGPLEFAPDDRHAGSQPRVTAAAYTHNVPAAPTTRLFDIDWKLDALLLQDPPNDGVLQTVGPLGVDFGELGAFDILTGSTGEELAIAGSGQTLYRVDLEKGSAHAVGSIDDDAQIIGISMFPSRSESR